LILNDILVGASVVSHESDQVEVPPNHAMEDADWVHKGSKVEVQDQWMHQRLCGYLATSSTFGQQTWTSHGGRQIWSSFSCVGGPRQQNHHAMNA